MASGKLGQLYAKALIALGVEIEFHDAEKAGMNGMYKVANALWGN
jgi:2-keto-3-deoxy-galactonokinase